MRYLLQQIDAVKPGLFYSNPFRGRYIFKHCRELFNLNIEVSQGRSIDPNEFNHSINLSVPTTIENMFNGYQ